MIITYVSPFLDISIKNINVLYLNFKEMQDTSKGIT
jgi:hypothetical protein